MLPHYQPQLCDIKWCILSGTYLIYHFLCSLKLYIAFYYLEGEVWYKVTVILLYFHWNRIMSHISPFHSWLPWFFKKFVFISSALTLFKHIQSDVNRERWRLVMQFHRYMLRLFTVPLGRVLHRTLTTIWVGKAVLWRKQFGGFSWRWILWPDRFKLVSILCIWCWDYGWASAFLCLVTGWVIIAACI